MSPLRRTEIVVAVWGVLPGQRLVVIQQGNVFVEHILFFEIWLSTHGCYVVPSERVLLCIRHLESQAPVVRDIIRFMSVDDDLPRGDFSVTSVFWCRCFPASRRRINMVVKSMHRIIGSKLGYDHGFAGPVCRV